MTAYWGMMKVSKCLTWNGSPQGQWWNMKERERKKSHVRVQKIWQPIIISVPKLASCLEVLAYISSMLTIMVPSSEFFVTQHWQGFESTPYNRHNSQWIPRKCLYFNIFKNIFSCDGKAEFSAAITPVFSVTWSFTSYSNGTQEAFLVINAENNWAV